MKGDEPRIAHGNLPDHPPKILTESHDSRPHLPHSQDRHPSNWVPVQLRGTEDPCEGCGKEKPPEHFSRFLDRTISLDADEAPPYLCDQCVTYGAPMSDPMGKLSVKERQAMVMLAAGGKPALVAKRLGVSTTWLNDRLSGRDKGIFREAFQAVLIHEGLGPDAVIGALKRAITGKRNQWNPEEKDFAQFEDHNVQLRAAENLIKIMNLNPPQELSRNVDDSPAGPGMQLVIQTNIGDGKELTPQEYVIDTHRARSGDIEAESRVIEDE